jgi:hypothetical protein
MKYTINTLNTSIFVALLAIGGCLSKFTEVNFDYNTEALITTVELTTTGSQTFGEVVVTSGLKSELENNNTSLDQLDELKLKSAKISFASDSMANFDNIENIELWLSADGNPEVLIASKTPIDKGSKSIELTINNTENLANYIKASVFTYTIKGNNTTPIPVMELKVNATWKIKASAD